jgi:hypothetical protein
MDARVRVAVQECKRLAEDFASENAMAAVYKTSAGRTDKRRAKLHAAIDALAALSLHVGDAADLLWSGPSAPEPKVSALRVPPAGADTLCQRLQQRCSDWGVYWRASDSHGVDLSRQQAVELLRDALCVEVEIVALPPTTNGVAAVKTANDTTRLEWLLHHLSGKELRHIGVEVSAGGLYAGRIAIDTAMSKAVPQITEQKGMDLS